MCHFLHVPSNDHADREKYLPHTVSMPLIFRPNYMSIVFIFVIILILFGMTFGLKELFTCAMTSFNSYDHGGSTMCTSDCLPSQNITKSVSNHCMQWFHFTEPDVMEERYPTGDNLFLDTIGLI